MKKPSALKRGRAQKALIECSSDSLAVFYVEQVALNRHVSSTESIDICNLSVKRYPWPGRTAFFRKELQVLLAGWSPSAEFRLATVMTFG